MAAARPDRTPYIIYVLSALQAAGGAYLGSQHADTAAMQKALNDQDRAIAVIQSSMTDRRRYRDEQVVEILARVDRLEHRR